MHTQSEFFFSSISPQFIITKYTVCVLIVGKKVGGIFYVRWGFLHTSSQSPLKDIIKMSRPLVPPVYCTAGLQRGRCIAAQSLDDLIK